MRIRKRLAPSSDLQLRRSEAAPPSDQPQSQNNTWLFPNEKEERGDETLRSMEETNNDIRKIVKSLHPIPPLSSIQEEYKVVPLKKREGGFERIPETREKVKKEKRERGTVVMEGSRCSRVNGRGWRCCQPTLVGYSLCQHHLGKGRLSGGAPPSKEEEKPLVVVAKKRTKVGVVKARSMSSLLSQI